MRRILAAALLASLLASPASSQFASSPGNVIGAASSTDGHCALFNGTSGKKLKDGGACPGGGGGSLTVTDGTNSVTSTTTITTGNGLVVGGSAGSATITPTVPNVAKSADYTVAATDMGGCIELSGSHTLTIPAISSTVLASGMTTCYHNGGAGTWTLSSTPTIVGMTGTSLPPGSGATLLSNGTALQYEPGMQPPSTTVLGGVLALGATSHQFLTSISTAGAPAAAQPAFTDISGTAQVAQGGTGVTSAQGNGTKVQLSTGTTTTNDCVKFDANGNTVDAGAACGSGGGGAPGGTGSEVQYRASSSTFGAVTSASSATGINLGSAVAPVDALDIDQGKGCLWGTTDHVTNFTNVCASIASNNPTIISSKGGTGVVGDLTVSAGTGTGASLNLNGAGGASIRLQIAGSKIFGIDNTFLSANVGAGPALANTAIGTTPNITPANNNSRAGLGADVAGDTSIYTDASGTSRETNRFTATNAADGATVCPETFLYGGNSHVSKRCGQTTASVTTGATTIFTPVGDGTMLTVCGSDGTNRFCDLLNVSTVSVQGICVTTCGLVAGSPTVRTYSVSTGNIQLAMASGTYAINAFGFEAGQR